MFMSCQYQFSGVIRIVTNSTENNTDDNGNTTCKTSFIIASINISTCTQLDVTVSCLYYIMPTYSLDLFGVLVLPYVYALIVVNTSSYWNKL